MFMKLHNTKHVSRNMPASKAGSVDRVSTSPGGVGVSTSSGGVSHEEARMCQRHCHFGVAGVPIRCAGANQDDHALLGRMGPGQRPGGAVKGLHHEDGHSDS